MKPSSDKKYVVYAESLLKKEFIYQTLRRLGFTNLHGIATLGRLFDFKEPATSFDRASLEGRMVPIRPNLVQFVSKISEDHIGLIFSDNDDEGELIARDIAEMHDRSGTPWSRFRIHEVTEQAIKSSLSQPQALNQEIINKTLARRLTDSIIGSQLSSKAHRGHRHSVGRVSTPTVSELKSAPHNSTKCIISKKLRDGCNSLWLNIKLPYYSEPLASLVRRSMDQVELPRALRLEASITERDRLFTGADALLGASKVTGLKVKESAAVLQQLYETGKISYHRTDSSSLPEEQAQKLSRIGAAFNAALDFDYNRHLPGAEADSHLSHHAIVPTHISSDVAGTPKDLPASRAILAMIQRQALRSGLENRVNTTLSYEIPKEAAWTALVSQCPPGSRVTIESKATYKNSRQVSCCNPATNFCGLEYSEQYSNVDSAIVLPNDIVALEAMVNLGVGRPSTYAIHAESISRRYMDKSGEIDTNGLRMIEYATRNAPGLLTAKGFLEISEALSEQGAGIAERVSNALNVVFPVNQGKSRRASDQSLSDDATPLL